MIRWLFSLLMLAVAVPAAAKGPPVRITLTRADGGDWLIDYDFMKRSPVWLFGRSATDRDGKPWRAQSWTVETPGVRMLRLGHYDALVGDGQPLRRVRIRMRPFTLPLVADYSPVLAFSDGGVALYGGHFVVMPQPTAAAVEALPPDLNGYPIDFPSQALILSDPGRRMLVGGKTYTGRVQIDGEAADTYLYSGDAPVIETPAFAGVLDPGLPAWARTELYDFTPRLMRLYADRLGKPAGGKPMAFVAWQGVEGPSYSFGGSVATGMVVMQLSGRSALDPNPKLLDMLRWFIGHESAHFWMGQTVHYSRRNEAWIMEGSADLLAVRALSELVPGYDTTAELNRESDDCLAQLGPNTPLATLAERGDTRVQYACGAMLAMIAETVQKRHDGGDFFAFIRTLIDANRADEEVTADDWLAALGRAGAGDDLVTQIRTLLFQGVDDPAAAWARLMAEASLS